MAELDYAYLADYAQIENGKISALGASYTHAIVPALPTGWSTTVVGRVRVPEDAEPVLLRIELTPPDDSFKLQYEGMLEQQPGFRPYRGLVGLLFTVTAQVPLPAVGLYRFNVWLDDMHVRELAFDVALATDA